MTCQHLVSHPDQADSDVPPFPLHRVVSIWKERRRKRRENLCSDSETIGVGRGGPAMIFLVTSAGGGYHKGLGSPLESRLSPLLHLYSSSWHTYLSLQALSVPRLSLVSEPSHIFPLPRTPFSLARNACRSLSVQLRCHFFQEAVSDQPRIGLGSPAWFLSRHNT